MTSGSARNSKRAPQASGSESASLDSSVAGVAETFGGRLALRRTRSRKETAPQAGRADRRGGIGGRCDRIGSLWWGLRDEHAKRPEPHEGEERP